jgi:hypothetical protein
VFVLLTGGIAFYLLRRKGKDPDASKLRAPISYPRYSRQVDPPGSRDTAELGILSAGRNDGGPVMIERGVVSHTAELEATRARPPVWELQSQEGTRGNERSEKSEEWESYPAHKYKQRRGDLDF